MHPTNLICFVFFLILFKIFSNSHVTSWTRGLLRSVVHNVQIFGDSPDIFLLSISSKVPLRSEIILPMISVSLNQVKSVLWVILATIPRALVKVVLSDVIVWNVV